MIRDGLFTDVVGALIAGFFDVGFFILSYAVFSSHHSTPFWCMNRVDEAIFYIFLSFFNLKMLNIDDLLVYLKILKIEVSLNQVRFRQFTPMF